MTAPMPAVAQMAALTAADMAPPSDLAAAGPETAALTDTAMTGMEGTDTQNGADIGTVADPAKADPQGAQMMQSMLGALMGGIGALTSGLGAVTQLPQSLAQGVGTAAQSLSQLTQSNNQPVDDSGYSDPGYVDDPAYADTGYSDPGAGSPGGSTAAGTSTAEGPQPSSVIPVTGPPAARPSIPAGASVPPVTQPVAGTGMMPMPMGGMGAAGAQSAGAQTPEQPPKKLQTRTQPHTEPVAGKPPKERIARAAKPSDTRKVTLPKEQESP